MLTPKERKYLAWCLWHTGSTSKEACNRAFIEDFKITDIVFEEATINDKKRKN